MPGVPREMKSMLVNTILPKFINPHYNRKLKYITLLTSGVYENKLYIILKDIIEANSNNFKVSFLPNYIGQAHQLFTSQKNIPLSGGIFVLLIIIFIFQDNTTFLLISLSIFLIGIASDKNYVVSPKIRMILQILVVFILVYNLNCFLPPLL